MEYGLWNLPTGFWPAGNQANIPIDTIPRAPYYGPINGVPVFHSNINEGDLSHYAVTGSQSYRHQTEFLAAKNVPVLGGRSSVASISDDKSQLEDVPLPGELLEPRSMESLSSDSTQQPITPSPVLDDRRRMKLRKGSASFDESNGQQPDDYMKQQSYQHPMYGMLFNQMAVGKQEGPMSEAEEEDDEESKSQVAQPATPATGFTDGSESAPCRSPGSVDASTHAGFECGECGLVADTRPALKKHIAMSHPDLHMAESLEQKSSSVPTACPMTSCRFSTCERNEMEAHVARHVAEGFTPNGKKKACPVALQRVRYEREEYRCQLCAYSCTIEKAFYKHLKTHTMGLQPAPAPIKISCVICGKDRTSEVDMNKHMKKHRDDRFFCCDICIFKTVQLKKLIQHRRMHTGEKPHLCPHCSYRSARRDNLRSHVRRVHKKENLYCDTFSPRGLLLSASAPADASPAPSQPE